MELCWVILGRATKAAAGSGQGLQGLPRDVECQMADTVFVERIALLVRAERFNEGKQLTGQGPLHRICMRIGNQPLAKLGSVGGNRVAGHSSWASEGTEPIYGAQAESLN
jgi:hypothetical protein